MTAKPPRAEPAPPPTPQRNEIPKHPDEKELAREFTILAEKLEKPKRPESLPELGRVGWGTLCSSVHGLVQIRKLNNDTPVSKGQMLLHLAKLNWHGIPRNEGEDEKTIAAPYCAFLSMLAGDKLELTDPRKFADMMRSYSQWADDVQHHEFLKNGVDPTAGPTPKHDAARKEMLEEFGSRYDDFETDLLSFFPERAREKLHTVLASLYTKY